MHFNNFQINIGGGIFGSGSDTVGQFNLSGSVSGSGDVTFTKQYVGAHSVNYTGRFVGGKAIEGTWSVSGLSDKFRLEMDATEVWSGFYEQGGQKQNMSIDLSVDQNGVFGSGTDAVGQFVIRGQVQGPLVQFAKAYYGKHTVNYSGQLSVEGAGRVIRGWWNTGGVNGAFELRSATVGLYSGGGAGGFGQPAGGFGQPAGGAWGQPPAGGAWGQPPAGGAWGQPPAGGAWGQPPTGAQGGAWGQPPGGFGVNIGFGGPGAPPGWGQPGQGHGHGHGHAHGQFQGGLGGAPPGWGQPGQPGQGGHW